ncbi:MAG: SagB/ThcOx family dehydrogenase [Nitrospirota bacterium]|nr:SagB/ThcOx family dehydrogenase [Nitrospirota bacterium]
MQSSPEISISRLFHQETKYIAGEMGRFNRPAGKPPAPFKEYQSEHTVDLIGYLPFERHPFTGKDMPPVPETGGPALKDLSHLLYFSNGVTAIMPYPDGTRHALRAAPSAGALYPTEIYVAARGVDHLENGVYHYLAKNHSLVPVWEGDAWPRLSAALSHHGAVEQSGLVLLLTGLWTRSTWRYHERAYRRILLDTGHVLGNITLLGPEYGFGAFPVGGFADAAINDLLFLDDNEEALLTAVALPRLDAVNLDLVPPCGALPSGTVAGTADPDTLLVQAHRGGNIERPEPYPALSPVTPETTEIPWRDAPMVIGLDHEPIRFDEGVEAALLRRRSTRAFSGAPLSLNHLGAILSFSYQLAVTFGERGTALRQVFDPTLLGTWIVATNVYGLDPGLYYYAPGAHELRLAQGGDLRAACSHICLGQELARDAAALVIHTFDLDRAAERYGDRGYRYAHLDAGHIGERMNLAALALGMGASGIGGFYDNDVTRLLDLPPETAVAYITTLGVPAATG